MKANPQPAFTANFRGNHHKNWEPVGYTVEKSLHFPFHSPPPDPRNKSFPSNFAEVACKTVFGRVKFLLVTSISTVCPVLAPKESEAIYYIEQVLAVFRAWKFNLKWLRDQRLANNDDGDHHHHHHHHDDDDASNYHPQM
ncbi:predicted protein [Histoplasma capsulatum G186AR]|uniref:Uncharacterized protein n=1 Tax=Ajellomyces capsulatus (strain G186AR / H82 / ATCC MYA-2454 / RMSCC 2432) TaxID=447093 RepID=C0NG39_AJECG|nr:uncharacterized protein HCBG_01855 [Histoplasma capsulatum G186AR]EEH10210.1 predicted protein [Histoplasma capsulatum G186AR]